MKREARCKLLDHGAKGLSDAGEVFQLAPAIVERMAIPSNGTTLTHDPAGEMIGVNLDVDQWAAEKFHSAL